MASLWSTGNTAESGILRKNEQKDRLDDLLVFGYACKLFRDDEKAKEIDQGKHLIPWMGDDTLKIDRYDGRGALSDLSAYVASKEGYDAMRWLGLNDADRKIEQLCDEERYFALKTNDDEDEMYKEEEQKRAQSNNQIHYNYEDKKTIQNTDDESKSQNEENNHNNTTIPEENDEPFVVSPELDIPINMALPSTVKQNTRIEKTALFISEQGPQMEILLKTKQSGNPQFSFLNQDDPLYRYYRHVLMAIKTGRYKVRQLEPHKSETTENDDDDQHHQQTDYYLHPSLASITTTTASHPEQNYSLMSTSSTSSFTSTFSTTFPLIQYKPSADCAYFKLINKIKGTTTNNITSPHTSYYNYYTPYHPQMIVKQEEFLTPSQLQQQQQQQSSASSMMASTLATASLFSLAAQYTDDGEDDETNDDNDDDGGDNTNMGKMMEMKSSDRTMMGIFGGGSGGGDAIVIPTPDIQLIIDKMAVYVAKNGVDFENIVKMKGDQRFVFLERGHIYHSYYKFKLKQCLEQGKIKKQEKDGPDGEDGKKGIKSCSNNNNNKEKKIITPVCFSIKKSTNKEIDNIDKSALPLEESTDDDDDKVENSNKNEGEGMKKGGEFNHHHHHHLHDGSNDDVNSYNSNNCGDNNERVVSINYRVGDEKESCGGGSGSNQFVMKNKCNSESVIEIEDPIMELIDLTEEFEEKSRERRAAEDKVKDKIAALAREKLAEKNRALQMERKKRAAAFLSQLKPPQQQENIQEFLMPTTSTKITDHNGEQLTQNLEDYSRLIYHIEVSKDNQPQNNKKKKSHKRSRSRTKTTSTTNHNNHHHHHHHHKHHKHHKYEKKSHNHRGGGGSSSSSSNNSKKVKRRRHHSRSKSRSRSISRHRKTNDNNNKKEKQKRQKCEDATSQSSDAEY